MHRFIPRPGATARLTRRQCFTRRTPEVVLQQPLTGSDAGVEGENDGSVLVFLAHNMLELHQMARGVGLGVWSAIARFHGDRHRVSAAAQFSTTVIGGISAAVLIRKR